MPLIYDGIVVPDIRIPAFAGVCKADDNGVLSGVACCCTGRGGADGIPGSNENKFAALLGALVMPGRVRSDGWRLIILLDDGVMPLASGDAPIRGVFVVLPINFGSTPAAPGYAKRPVTFPCGGFPPMLANETFLSRF